ncbi:hypothetical protein HDU96_008746 [Phlyctochytrium bullatum]|nr:hypothetical protein HDU96_008746 [Phlyctochytrium bullatum]
MSEHPEQYLGPFRLRRGLTTDAVPDTDAASSLSSASASQSADAPSPLFAPAFRSLLEKKKEHATELSGSYGQSADPKPRLQPKKSLVEGWGGSLVLQAMRQASLGPASSSSAPNPGPARPSPKRSSPEPIEPPIRTSTSSRFFSAATNAQEPSRKRPKPAATAPAAADNDDGDDATDVDEPGAIAPPPPRRYADDDSEVAPPPAPRANGPPTPATTPAAPKTPAPRGTAAARAAPTPASAGPARGRGGGDAQRRHTVHWEAGGDVGETRRGEVREGRTGTREADDSEKRRAKVLSGVRFAISGLQNPARDQIRRQAIAMGARYEPNYSPSCRLLVCPFADTPKIREAKAAVLASVGKPGGKEVRVVVVLPEFVERCWKDGELCGDKECVTWTSREAVAKGGGGGAGRRGARLWELLGLPAPARVEEDDVGEGSSRGKAQARRGERRDQDEDDGDTDVDDEDADERPPRVVARKHAGGDRGIPSNPPIRRAHTDLPAPRSGERARRGEDEDEEDGRGVRRHVRRIMSPEAEGDGKEEEEEDVVMDAEEEEAHVKAMFGDVKLGYRKNLLEGVSVYLDPALAQGTADFLRKCIASAGGKEAVSSAMATVGMTLRGRGGLKRLRERAWRRFWGGEEGVEAAEGGGGKKAEEEEDRFAGFGGAMVSPAWLAGCLEARAVVDALPFAL